MNNHHTLEVEPVGTSSENDNDAWLVRINDVLRTETTDGPPRADGIGNLKEGTSYRVCPNGNNNRNNDVIGGYFAVYNGVACRNVVGGNAPVRFAETTPPYVVSMDAEALPTKDR